MTIYNQLKNYLTTEKRARERMNKNKVISLFVMKDHSKLNQIPLGEMSDIVGEILTSDRAWRKVLEKNEELRGSDYSKKGELETEKKKELGYKV